MKCPKCGMNYEGSECPNCKVASFFDKSRAFQTEQEFDEYLKEQNNKKLKSHVNRWSVAFCVLLVFSILFAVAYVFGVFVDSRDIQIIFGTASNSCFIASVLCLLFYYLSDIRRQLILLNQKK